MGSRRSDSREGDDRELSPPCTTQSAAIVRCDLRRMAVSVGMAERARLPRRLRDGPARDLYLACGTIMVTPSFTVRYTAAMVDCGGSCPIEAGVLGRLADHECRHGRLPLDRTPACGCWPQEGAAVTALPRPHISSSSTRRAA